MATGIFYAGKLTHVPGSYVEVDASGLSRVGLGASGIVGCIGEAEGGKPQNVYSVTNPAKTPRIFRSGDLLEASGILFEPSKDADIPGGAQEVKFIKVNPATQSAFTFENGAGPSVTITSKDYGLYTAQIAVSIATDGNGRRDVTVTLEDTQEIFPDIGLESIFSVAYDGGAPGADTMTLTVDPEVGVTALFTKLNAGLVTDYVGQITGLSTLAADKDADIGSGHSVTVVSASASDTAKTITIYGISAGSPASETLTLNGTTPVIGSTLWTRVYGAVLSAASVGVITVTDTTDTTQLLQINAASATAGGGVRVFTVSIENGSSTLQIKADGAATGKVLLIGTNTSGVAQLEEVTLNGTTFVTTAGSWNSISAIALSYVDASRAVTIDGPLWDVGDIVTAVSSSASDAGKRVTVYGLDAAGLAQSEVITLNGTTPVPGVATWSKVLGASLSAAAAGAVTLSSETESVVAFVIAALATTSGLAVVDDVSISGKVTLTASGATTQVVLVLGLGTTGQAQVEKVTLTGTTPVLTTANWTALTGIALGHVPADRNITSSGKAADLAVADYDTVRKVTDFLNSKGGWTVTEQTASGTTFGIANMDVATAVAVDTSPAVAFYADLYALIATLNAGSSLVVATREDGATGLPDDTASPVYLVGGIEGVTLFSHWQAALDLLRSYRVNTVIALTDSGAVQAAVNSHCVYMAGAGRSDRDAVLGTEEGADIDAMKAAALALNSRHCRLLGQNVVRYNTAGLLESFPPFFAACIVAGMQAGSSVGTPLTHKFTNVIDVEGDASYNTLDDGDDLIQSGVLLLEKVPNRGHRVLRNVTTWLQDDNLAYVEGSVNHAVNFVVFEFREKLEFAVGKAGFAGTVNAVHTAAAAILGELVTLGAATAWQRLVVELEGDVLTVDVEVAPTLPVNFVKSTIHLVNAPITAAA